MTRFVTRDLPIKHALTVAGAFWPTFCVQDGHIFVELTLGNGISISDRTVLGGDDRTGTESLVNHVHILALFEHGDCWSESRSRYRRSHAHFKAAERLGRAIAEMWFEKLCRDFPDDDFRVYYTRDDDPIVRFHRIYPGETPWTEPDAQRLASGAIIVHDSRARRPSRTAG
jgi:hypothetical protein